MRVFGTLSAVEAVKQTRAGTIRATDLVEAALERIEALNGRLQAFMTIDEAGARRTAERLDALPAAQRGPLHGLPIAFKDLVATAEVRTTYGSQVYADNKPTANELFVNRTLEAGGVLIGKTTTPEFGFGAICQNRLAGPTANPYDLNRTSGGSSGGSAVAVCTRHGGNCPRDRIRGLLPYSSKSYRCCRTTPDRWQDRQSRQAIVVGRSQRPRDTSARGRGHRAYAVGRCRS